MDTEIKNTTPFKIAQKNEILRCKFSKIFTRFVCWNYTMLMKEIKALNKREAHSKDVKFFPKWIHRFNAIPVKIPTRYFVDTDKIILKFLWKGQRN